MAAGLAGLRKATAPPGWAGYAHDFGDAAEFRPLVQRLDVLFGDGIALAEVRALALDAKADLARRQAALETLIAADPPDLRAVCEKLLKVRFLNAVAARGLARFDDPAAGKAVVNEFNSFHPTDRPAVIEALASRPAFAAALLDAVAVGTIPRGDLSAAQVRQIRAFGRPDLTKKLAAAWGEFRDSPKDKADLIAKLKAELTPARLATGDKAQGRAVFAKTCASCHRLFGTGAEIGPDLTGAGRKDLDYLLTNVVDPSAVVSKDFQVTALALRDGRVVTGIVAAETEQKVTVQTATARVMIPKTDVESREPSTQSLMPDGLLQPLTADQVRDLIAYLMADAQVDLPPGEK
jgi:putative heme-binding domain-containing protein